MKKKKGMTKIAATALSVLLIASMTACGVSSSTASASESTTANTESTASSAAASSGTAAAASATSVEKTHAADPEESKTEVTGTFSVSTSVSDGITVEDGVYTITKGGTYTFSGTLEEGQIVVDADDEKVEIVLDGVVLTCSTDAAIKAGKADKLTITVADGTYNEVNDTRALRESDEEDAAGGAIYAKCDLVITGTGSLVVTGSYNNGIHTTKDLTIEEVTLKVTAANNAVKGKNSVTISSGNLTIISTGGDGIKTENTDVSSKGNQKGSVVITGGVVDIYAAGDGIDAAYNVEINKGDAVVNIYTDSYSSYTGEMVTSTSTTSYLIVTQSMYNTYPLFAAYYYNTDEEEGVWVTAEYAMNCYSGNYTFAALEVSVPLGYTNVAYYAFSGTEITEENYAASTDGEAINTSMNAYLITGADGTTISGDYTNLSTSSNGNSSTTSTKGIKAGNEIYITAGTITIESTDDALHANEGDALENGSTGTGNITIAGGTLTLTSGDDGIHADNTVTITDGTVNVVKSYEGIEGNQIFIQGGTIYVYATDDGLNACGGDTTPLIEVSGGSMIVKTANGDTDGIDSNGNYVQSGGFVLVLGGASQGMVAGSVDVDGSVYVTGGTIVALGGICETPASGSVNTVIMSGQSFSEGTYQVTDGSGNVIIEFTVDSGNYSNAWIASDAISTGSSYSLTKSGSSVYSWTQSSSTEGSAGNSGFGGGGMGGMNGGFGGGGMGGGGRR